MPVAWFFVKSLGGDRFHERGLTAQGVDAVHHCLIHHHSAFCSRGFHVLATRDTVNGLKAITRSDAVVIKSFLTSLHQIREGTFDINCTRAAMEDHATMAVCQAAALDVLAHSILCDTMMVCLYFSRASFVTMLQLLQLTSALPSKLQRRSRRRSNRFLSSSC